MKGIALLGLLALAPLAQAGTPFAGRDLTPPADFIAPDTGSIGTRVELVMPPAQPAGIYGGRDLTPPAAFIAPSTGQRIGTRVMPATTESRTGTDYGNNLVDYGADHTNE